MDSTISMPYGRKEIKIVIPNSCIVDTFYSPKSIAKRITDEQIHSLIKQSISDSPGSLNWNKNTKVVIAINDKTRPVPNSVLLPPLLSCLKERGITNNNINFIISSGTHTPMRNSEFLLILPQNIVENFRIIAHNCDNENDLTYKGVTSRGTPVYINKVFEDSDLRIVVGDIEPHHFAGFSGGVKSAAIGLTGRKTINANHSLLIDKNSFIGIYENNPLRQDIEEIGRIIRVDYALNAVLDEQKNILKAFFGSPQQVMVEGVEFSRSISLTTISKQYDFVIASAGGYPKDINFYQSQKALTHASLFCKDEGMVFLLAECIEGVGSDKYFQFVKGMLSHESVMEKFRNSEFEVGPHKAFQVAKIASRIHFKLFTEIDLRILKDLLIEPIHSLDREIFELIHRLPKKACVAVLPYATSTIPRIMEDK
jgi:lactate racemase